MPIPKRYIHDRFVLLLISVGTFLTVLITLLVLLRLGDNQGSGYIVQYRANLGISAFHTGNLPELLALPAFSIVVLVVHTLISMRIYNISRQFALAVLSLGILLLILSIIVSNALLVLR